eukprot:3938991-Lingulodinium_polyedra.AAC.1
MPLGEPPKEPSPKRAKPADAPCPTASTMQDMVAAFREVIRSEGLATKTDLARVHERMDQQEARLS